MAKKLTLLSVVMFLLGITTFAQSGPCGFDVVHKKLLLANHEYESSVRSSNNSWIQYQKMLSKAKFTVTPRGYVYEIPIVIQVIHSGGAVGSIYNPDSATLAGMVAYLNDIYAATVTSPVAFPDTTTGATGGGTRIPLKFILAKRTPGGLATNGIVRYDASGISNYVMFGINSDSVRGLNPDQVAALSRWDPASYYNVYVVNKIDSNDLTRRGGVAGFAYFPGTPTLDGMYVVATQARTGSTTVAHEFGHAYNLYHTFEGDAGGSACPSPESDCTSEHDMICDTEPHKRSSSWGAVSPFIWCPPNDVNPCTGKSYKNVQNNIMDYTQCPPNRFTKGQRDRILNTIDGKRVGFKSSAGLLAPTTIVTPATCAPTSASTTAAVGPYVVSLNGMTVWTGDMFMENAAYVDHAYTQQTQLEKGIPYAINVTTESNKQNVKVFIDLNNDGDFADAGEEVFTHTGTTAGEEVHSGLITLPSTVTTCQWLRMRVVAAFPGLSAASFACGPYSANAQAEDYAIYVKNRTAVDTVTIAQTAGTNPSCTGSSVSFTATPKAGTPAYKWFLNGKATTVTTATYTSSTLANNDVLTCKTYYTGTCGPDSAESNAITVLVSSTVPAKANVGLIRGTNPGCAGLALTFNVNVISGGPTPHYQWKMNGTNVGTDVDTYATTGLAAGSKVWCVVTPNSSCSTIPVNSDTMVIAYGKVTPVARMSQSAGTNPSCDSTMLTFTANAIDGGDAPKYAWFVNGVAKPGATSDVYSDQFLKNNDTVTCRIISNHPCIVPGIGDTAWSDTVIVLRDPKIVPTLGVAITYGYNPGCLDSLLEFTATYSDAGGSASVTWYVNGVVAAYGPIFSSAAFLDNDVLTCKLDVTPGSCNTVDSLLYGPLTIKRSSVPPTPVISLIGNLLISSVTTNIQWYGPDGLIPGATSSTYHPIKKGNYYAVSDNGGCLSPMSNVLNVALLSISPANMSSLHIYPNPTSGNITLDWGAEKVSAAVDVFTLTGQKVYSGVVDNDTRKAIDLSALSNGNYLIVIHDQEGKTGTAKITLSR